MQIFNIGLKIPQINFKSNVVKHFTTPMKPDTFESSKPSVEKAVEEISKLETADGCYRFSKKDTENFGKLYKNNQIDIDTVKTFADTRLNINEMSSLYKMYKESLKDGIDMKKNAYETIHNQVKDIEAYDHKATVSPSLFDSKNEISIKDEAENIKYTISRKGEKLAKSYFKDVTFNDRTIRDITTEDYRTNSVNTKLQKIDIDRKTGRIEGFSTYKEIIDYKDENGKTKYQRVSTLSDEVEGNTNIQIIYPNGKTKDISKSTKDSKTGIVTIKKDFISPDGTRTNYLYEDDPQGNRIIDYKITDEKGKVIYQNSQTFEKISDTKFISSNDARKYEINVGEKSLSVKELGLGKEETIQFKKKVEKFNREEMISLLKKVPGHLLFESAQDVKKYSGLQKDEALLAYSLPTEKTIASADNLFIFLHELGHIKDSETVKSKDGSKRHHNESQYTGNKKIQDTYLKELDNFVKKYPHEQRENAGYFLENDKHYAGKWGALGEIVAETNAIGSAKMTKDSECVSFRTDYLQENFPKTIAEIKNAMRWKDDLDAIEFYGT